MRSFLTASARRSNSTALYRYWSAREVISPVSSLNPVWAAAARRSGQPRHSGRPAQLSASTPLPNSQTEPEDEGSGWLRLYSVVLGPHAAPLATAQRKSPQSVPSGVNFLRAPAVGT